MTICTHWFFCPRSKVETPMFSGRLLKKLRTIHEITLSGTKGALGSSVSCAFVDRLYLAENGPPLFHQPVRSEDPGSTLTSSRRVNAIQSLAGASHPS